TRADPWAERIHPVVQDIGAAGLIARGMPRSTAYRAVTGAQPRGSGRGLVEAAAVERASLKLADWGVAIARSPAGVLDAYLRERQERGEDLRRCQWCGEPLPPSARADARYDKPACRKAAQRARSSDRTRT